MYFIELKIFSSFRAEKARETYTPGFTGGYSYMALSEPVVITSGVQKS
jgi:hypothetical protein